MLKFNRPHLPATYRASMPTVLCALITVLAMWIGNIVAKYAISSDLSGTRVALTLLCSPVSLGLWAASFSVIFSALLLVTAQPAVVRLLLRLHGSSPLATYQWTAGWRSRLISWYRRSRNARVCVWIKDDNVTIHIAVSVYQADLSPRFTQCYRHSYPCKGTLQTPGRLSLYTHIRTLITSRANCIQTRAYSTKLSRLLR